jgi:hypothetical protein
MVLVALVIVRDIAFTAIIITPIIAAFSMRPVSFVGSTMPQRGCFFDELTTTTTSTIITTTAAIAVTAVAITVFNGDLVAQHVMGQAP